MVVVVLGALRVEWEEAGRRAISIWPAGWLERERARRGRVVSLVVGRILGKGEGRGEDDMMVKRTILTLAMIIEIVPAET